MPLRLGMPEGVASAPLPRRLAFISVARLAFLTLLLALIGVFFARDEYDIESYTIRTAVATLGAAFALTAGYAFVLRSGKHLEGLAYAQLVLDQLTWTVAVYLSGGAASGATSFYGLTCLIGAVLIGARGAATAAFAGLCSYGVLLALLQSGLLSPPPDQPPGLYQLRVDEITYYALVNALVMAVVALLGIYLAERLRLTGGKLVHAERRAEQAERMAVLGQLAAGLAHEIRNPLGSISGSIQLLKSSDGLSEEDRQLCEIIQREAARLNDLVTDMMDLSRPRRPQLASVDAAKVAREVVELTSRSGRAATDVGVRYSGPLEATVTADASQLRQLIWNLVRNAVQASSAGDVVRVSIEAEADRVVLCVQDSGIGIEPEAKERLFDAFFTTRSHGTGVGLAVVKRIADEHGFSVDVESEQGSGAVFRIGLSPATPPVAAPSVWPTEASPRRRASFFPAR